MGDQGHQFFLYAAIVVVSGVLVLIIVAALIWLATSAARRKKKSRRTRRTARSASYPAPAPAPAPSPPPLTDTTAAPIDPHGNGRHQPRPALDETDYDLDLGMRTTPREHDGLDETDYDLAGSLSDTGGLSDSKFETAVGLADSTLHPDADSSTMMGGSAIDTGLSDSGALSPHTTTRDFSPRKRRPPSHRQNPTKKSDSPQPAPSRIPPEGPGSYRVVGVDKKTGLDTELILYAQSRANAKIKGQLKGIVVAKVQRIAD